MICTYSPLTHNPNTMSPYPYTPERSTHRAPPCVAVTPTGSSNATGTRQTTIQIAARTITTTTATTTAIGTVKTGNNHAPTTATVTTSHDHDNSHNLPLWQ